MIPITMNFIMAFTFSLLGTLMFWSHIMSTLLCLEGMMLLLFILITTSAINMQSMITYAIPIITLVFAACEAAVRLALLVMVSNTYSTDYVQNLNLLPC